MIYKRLTTAIVLAGLALPLFSLAQITPAIVEIHRVEPTPLQPGATFTIFGSGFTASNNTVTFVGPYGEKKFFLGSPTGSELSYKLPTYLTPGEYSVTVKNKGGAVSSPHSAFVATQPVPTPRPQPSPHPTISPQPTGVPQPTVSPVPAPHLASITPNPVSAGQEVMLSGSGFTRTNNAVILNGSYGEKKIFVGSPDGHTLVARIPTYITPGQYTVTVRNGQYATSNAVTLSVVAPPEDDDGCFLIIFCPGPDEEEETYVALGDSLATGVGAFRGYVFRYHEFIEAATNREVDADNFGRPGWQSQDLAEALQTNDSFQQAIREAEYITWNIGGNDLRAARDQYRARTCGGPDNQNCLRRAVEKFQQNWNTIVGQIEALSAESGVVIHTMTTYNPYVNEDKQRDSVPEDKGDDFRNLRPYWEAVNNHIVSTGERRGIAIARVDIIFNGNNGGQDPEDRGLISFDGFHPNDAGHKAIAQALRDLGFAEANNRPQPTSPPSPRPTFAPLPSFVPPTPLPTFAPRS